MITTIIVLLVIAAVLLTIVILIQNPKGGGLSSEFGGSSSQMFGVQRTGDIVEKLTWGFFTFLLVGSLATLIIFKSVNMQANTDSDVNVEKAESGAATLPSLPQTTPTTAPANTATADSTK